MSLFILFFLFWGGFPLFAQINNEETITPVVEKKSVLNESTKFYRKKYKGDVYAFKVVLEPNGYQKIIIERSENGRENWITNDTTINCTGVGVSTDVSADVSVDGSVKSECSVELVMSKKNKISLIYKLENFYYKVDSIDGLVWENATIIEKKKIINDYQWFFAEIPEELIERIEQNENGIENYDNIYFFICQKQLKHISVKKLSYICFLTYGNGKVYMTTYYFHFESYLENTILDQFFFFKGSFYMGLYVTPENIKYVVCSENMPRIFKCVLLQLFNSNQLYKIDYIAVSLNNYLIGIVERNGNRNIYISNDGKYFQNTNVSIISAEWYQLVSVSNDTVYIYFKGKDMEIIEFNSIDNLVKRKSGCEMVDESGINKILENTFSLKDDGFYYCDINYSDTDSSSDGLYKQFSIILKEERELEQDCFSYSFIKNVSNGTLKTNIIKFKMLGKTDNSNNFYETQFYFPVLYKDIYFNNFVTTCSSIDKKLHIRFTFNNYHRLSYTQLTRPMNVMSVKANEVINIYGCDSYVKDTNYGFPTGSYILEDSAKMLRIQVSNYIKESFKTISERTCKEQKKQITFNFTKGGAAYEYEGVDFTNSSNNYKVKEIKENTVDVMINNFKTRKTIGFVCPLSGTETTVNCFEHIYDTKTKQPISIYSLFGNVDVFVVPSRKMFGVEDILLESLLILEKNAVDILREEKSIIQFDCHCLVKDKFLTARYTIAPYYNDEDIMSQLKKENNENEVLEEVLEKIPEVVQVVQVEKVFEVEQVVQVEKISEVEQVSECVQAEDTRIINSDVSNFANANGFLQYIPQMNFSQKHDNLCLTEECQVENVETITPFSVVTIKKTVRKNNKATNTNVGGTQHIYVCPFFIFICILFIFLN